MDAQWPDCCGKDGNGAGWQRSVAHHRSPSGKGVAGLPNTNTQMTSHRRGHGDFRWATEPDRGRASACLARGPKARQRAAIIDAWAHASNASVDQRFRCRWARHRSGCMAWNLWEWCSTAGAVALAPYEPCDLRPCHVGHAKSLHNPCKCEGTYAPAPLFGRSGWL